MDRVSASISCWALLALLLTATVMDICPTEAAPPSTDATDIAIRGRIEAAFDRALNRAAAEVKDELLRVAQGVMTSRTLKTAGQLNTETQSQQQTTSKNAEQKGEEEEHDRVKRALRRRDPWRVYRQMLRDEVPFRPDEHPLLQDDVNIVRSILAKRYRLLAYLM